MSTDNTAHNRIAAYIRDGERKARELGNRGPLKFNPDGTADKEILDAYWHFGFYVFEGAVKRDELNDLQTELERAFERAPYTKDALLDSRGRQAIGTPSERSSFRFEKPLSDPDGGKGRHPAKMAVPEAPSDAPEYVISGISGPIQLLDSCFRLYGHPRLLSITEQINGPDFTPFSESMIVKPQAWDHRWRGIRTAPRTGIEVIWMEALTDLTSCFSIMGARRLTACGCFRDRTNWASST